MRPAAAAPASGRCLDGGDVTGDECGDQSAADLVPAEKLHVRGFHHCVGRFDRATKPLVSIMPNASSAFAMLRILQETREKKRSLRRAADGKSCDAYCCCEKLTRYCFNSSTFVA